MTATLEKSDPIAHPLDRLRGLIRRYVLIDGLITAGLFAVLWFWLGLIFDYGLFKATHFDWVLDAPGLLRYAAFAALALVLIGLLFTRLWLRLNRELSYPSLALVLEKRFPKILGDKLITAVELADVEKAKRQGYSEGMLRATIEEARERVTQVPVSSVFNWRRLRIKGGLLVLFAFGALLAAYGAFAAWRGNASPGLFASNFGDVSGIWAERNLMLQNTPWPRRAHLELIGFPGEELRIGRDSVTPPRVTAKAYKWVVADRKTVHGWRPMKVKDLGVFVNPSTLAAFRDDAQKAVDSVNVDEMEIDGYEQSSGIAEGTRLFEKLFTELDAIAGDAAHSRTIRKLAIPDAVTLFYSGSKTSGNVTLTREAGNVFTGDVVGLRESVRFTVKGSDFATRPRSITLVPPPMFARLTRTEYQPAYLWYPPPVTEPNAEPDFALLKDLRQKLAEKDLSLTGDKTVFSIVQGTELELAGQSDKRLAKVQLKPKIGRLPGQKAPTDVVEIEPEGPDRDSFRIAFKGADRPTGNLEFEIVLTDEDGVSTSRSILVQVTEDQAPQVDLAVDVLRKQGNMFMVTPAAMVPFLIESKVRDDLALGKVEFVYTVTAVETAAVMQVQAMGLAGVFANAPLAPNIANAYMPATSAVFTQGMMKNSKAETGAVMAGQFRDRFAGLRRETLPTLKARLAQPAESDTAQVVREIRFQSQQTDVFDIQIALPKLAAAIEAAEFSQRYRIDLALVATDANFETGPKSGASLDPIRLLVVSEADLLAEINRDEETQAGRLDEVIKKLQEAQGKLNQTADRLLPLSPPPDVLVSSAVRAQDIAQDIAKSREVTTGVLNEFKRLLKEGEFNRLRPDTLAHYSNEIIAPLMQILEKHFAESESAHQQVQLALAENRRPENIVVQADVNALMTLIAAVVELKAKLGEATTINKLRNELSEIRRKQKAITDALIALKRALITELYLPRLTSLPPIEMSKGETKSIKHAVNWNVFTGSLGVKFSGPAEAVLKFPDSAKVSDDREDFDYTLTAGQTPGEYKLTLTPSAGAPVTVIVRIK